MLGTFAVYYPPPRGPTEVERRLVDILTSTAGVAIERLRAEAALRESEQTARFLADASAALAVLVDYDSTLQKVANLAVPYFADWSAWTWPKPTAPCGGWRSPTWTRPRSNWPTSSTAASRPTPQCRRASGTSSARASRRSSRQITDDMLVQAVRDEEQLCGIVRELGLKSYICVPLGRGKTLGVLTFVTAESGRRYDDADLALAMDLAHRAAVAVENAQLYQANCGTPTAARTSSWRRWPTSSATRWPRSATACRSCGWPGGDAAAVEQARAMMERQVRQMVRLVDDLLDVCRISRGKIELRKERVELAAVVAAVPSRRAAR